MNAIKIVSEINDLVNHDFDHLQSFFDISIDWPIGESRLIDGSVNTKISQNRKEVRFLTQIPPLIKLDKLWHDCSKICTVLSGSLKDEITGRIWGVNEMAMFSKGQKHKPSNPSKLIDCYLLVIFQK